MISYIPLLLTKLLACPGIGWIISGDGWPLRGMILDSRLRGNDSVAMGGSFKRSLWVRGLELIIAY